MKFQFLGTCAAEGLPAFWCNCDVCRRSRALGGRAMRSRSQAIIDDCLLIDFPADTLMHTYQHGVDLLNVEHCLITHSHSDHLYPADIGMIRPGFSHLPEGYKLTFHGTEKMAEKLRPVTDPLETKLGIAAFCPMECFRPTTVGAYTVTALPAIHDIHAGPVFYQITDGEKTVLYAHDTHYFHEDVWNFWRDTKPHFDLVSLDCTNACLPLTYVGHMGLAENVKVRARMLELGIADEATKFVCNHFSHNGTNAVYDDFVPIAAKEGFGVSYDGMIVNI
ncbi:MAG: hypothetical protein E7632_13230 [Ruminococcaceae bacterium]|nr:hypothetical protein [Oscillospiraceae bacterium]